MLVKLEELDVEKKRVSLSVQTPKADLSGIIQVPREKWLQGVVQSVTNFGLFVRPAGFEVVGTSFPSFSSANLVCLLTSSSFSSSFFSRFGQTKSYSTQTCGYLKGTRTNPFHRRQKSH